MKEHPHTGDQPLRADQYEVLDIVFEIGQDMDAPFGVDFGAEFADDSGTTLRIPGFFNGGREWILRFSAPAAGTWRYTTDSSIGELDALSGEILVSAPGADRHGPIVIAEDAPRRLRYDDGTPYLLQAFECDWLFAVDYDNPTAAPKSEHLLDLLAENGINHLVTTVYSYDVKWPKDDKLKLHPEHEYGGRDGIFPFLGTNDSPDHSALNVTFFKRLDRLVDAMDRKGIVAHLMIYVWNKLVAWPEAGSVADSMYFDTVIKRYQAFTNVVWDVSKEALSNRQRCSEEYALERIDRIRRLDAYGRLVTVHDFGFCKRHADAVDIISIQTWRSTLYSDMLDIYETFEKPVFNIEHGGYEESPYVTFPGDYVDPAVCLRRNYLCYFAGTYATYYWQGAAWNVIIHNPFEQPEDFVKPKFEYYRYLQTFFVDIEYDRFHPCPQRNHSGYCMQADDGTYLFYLPSENYQLSGIGWLCNDTVQRTIRWFNVLTGEYSAETDYTERRLRSPWSDVDAIAVLTPTC